MKGFGVLFLIIFSVNLVNAAIIERDQNAEIFVLIENSIRLSNQFEYIRSAVDGALFNSFLSEDDHLHVIGFNNHYRILYTDDNVQSTNRYVSVMNALSEMNPSLMQVTFESFLHFMNTNYMKEPAYPARWVMLITAGFDRLIDHSELDSDEQIREQLIDACDQICRQGVNLILIGIGEDALTNLEFSSADIVTMVLPTDFSVIEFRNRLTNALVYIDLQMGSRIRNFKKDRHVKMTFTSHYPTNISTVIRGVTLQDVRRGMDITVTNSPNLLPNPILLELDPGETTNLIIPIMTVGGLKWGGYTAFLKLKMDDELRFHPGAYPVHFIKRNIWWIWVILAVLLILFKYYVREFFIRWEQSKLGVLLKPFRAVGKPFSEASNRFRNQHRGWDGFIERVSDAIDDAGIWTAGKIGAVLGFVWHYVKVAGLKVAQVLSKYVLIFPLGWFFHKSGKGLLRLNDKISKKEIAPLKKKVGLKKIRTRYPRMRY